MVMMIRPGQRLVIHGAQVYQPRAASGGSFSGVLDGISNVAAAYSLRKLRSAYSGYAVRVRRSSDSTEQDIGFDGSGNFDSSTFSSFVGGGTGYVKTWYDQSGNGRDAAQPTEGSQPIVMLSGINSKGSVSFNGTNNRLITNSFATVNQPCTWIHISKQNDTANRVPVSSGATPQIFWYNGNGSFNAGATLTKTAAVTNANIFSAIANYPSTSVFVNGGTPATGNAGPNPFSKIEIGNWNAYAYWYSGLFSEFIALAVSISTVNHNTIGNDMATYYGLSWTTVT